jgi:hypothetical protein
MPCALIERARMVGPTWSQVNGLLCLLREREWRYGVPRRTRMFAAKVGGESQFAAFPDHAPAVRCSRTMGPGRAPILAAWVPQPRGLFEHLSDAAPGPKPHHGVSADFR